MSLLHLKDLNSPEKNNLWGHVLLSYLLQDCNFFSLNKPKIKLANNEFYIYLYLLIYT